MFILIVFECLIQKALVHLSRDYLYWLQIIIILLVLPLFFDNNPTLYLELAKSCSKPIERKYQQWSFNLTMGKQLILFFPVLFWIQRENITGKFKIKKIHSLLLSLTSLFGERLFWLFVFSVVLFCWVFLGIVGRGSAWHYYWQNQKFPLMLME